MVEHEYKDLFYKRNTDKQLKIATDDGLFTATNSDIKWENFELTESLCSDSELRFGSCETSTVKFQILNAFIPLSGKWLTITETIGENTNSPFQYGRYKVFSDKPTADKEYRDIVAYDVMYDILNADISEWYNTILPNKDSKKSLRQFRESFVKHFGLTEVVPEDGLINDNMTVERTIDPEQISGKDVITAICEINGCFGHIGRDGKFHYIYLPQDIQGLYPADFLYPDHVPEQWDYLSQAETGHLYPQTPKGEKIGNGRYIKCQYEDYVVRTINKLQIRTEENDIGVIYGTGDNCYVIQDNFLVYGKTTSELNVIAENIYNKIRGVIYRPFSAECPGNPCLEVGDPIRLQTKYKIVESYILKRTLKGIQGLRDNYSSNGLEKRSENINSVQKSIIQLKGKANILTRTIEETKLEMYDIENGLKNNISVTAAGLQANITAEKNRAENEEERLSNNISVTAAQIRTELTAEHNRAKGEEEKLSNTITATASEFNVKLTAEKTRAEGEEERLSSVISATATQIRTEVSNSDANLQSQITQNAGDIALRVTKDGVVSAINLSPESITIKAGKIDLQGLVNADELVSKFATITTLNATKANLESVIATKATITDLSATNARVVVLETDRITASEVAASYATITSLNAVNAKFNNLNADNIKSGTLSADRIDVGSIVSTISLQTPNMRVGALSAASAVVSGSVSCGQFSLGGNVVGWKTTTIGNTTITYLG